MCSIIYLVQNQNIKAYLSSVGSYPKRGRCTYQWIRPTTLERLLKVDKKEGELLISYALLKFFPPLSPQGEHIYPD
jgi:hypothetical protein